MEVVGSWVFRLGGRIHVSTKFERRARHKLAVLRHPEEISGNVAATFRYYGISRTAYDKWRRRYEEEGYEGLKDRSSIPHHQPTGTDPEVVEKILWLRQQYPFGPRKISMYLARYHDVTVSPSGIWRILNKLGLSRSPASQRSDTSAEWQGGALAPDRLGRVLPAPRRRSHRRRKPRRRTPQTESTRPTVMLSVSCKRSRCREVVHLTTY